MEVEQTREFEKDIKKITAKTKQRIDDIVKLLAKQLLLKAAKILPSYI